jgi:hypothetical protein
VFRVNPRFEMLMMWLPKIGTMGEYPGMGRWEPSNVWRGFLWQLVVTTRDRKGEAEREGAGTAPLSVWAKSTPTPTHSMNAN